MHDRSDSRGRLEIPINRSCPRNRIEANTDESEPTLLARKKKRKRKTKERITLELHRCRNGVA